MGRPLLADPDLCNKAYENRFDDITPCGSCGGSCITRTAERPQCRCHINPRVGHEYDYPDNPTDKPKKTLIIGAGPGGMYAAVTAAERGHDVTVWEADDKIGGQLNLAVTSPGKQEMTKWLVHLNYRAKKAGVKFEFGREATVEAVREFNPDAVIVATGAKPLIPPIQGHAGLSRPYRSRLPQGQVRHPEGPRVHPRRRRGRLRDGRDDTRQRPSDRVHPRLRREHRRRRGHHHRDAPPDPHRRLHAQQGAPLCAR